MLFSKVLQYVNAGRLLIGKRHGELGVEGGYGSYILMFRIASEIFVVVVVVKLIIICVFFVDVNSFCSV